MESFCLIFSIDKEISYSNKEFDSNLNCKVIEFPIIYL